MGSLLAGKYRVERVLGQGGMGVVVAARHIQLQELVALKFLLPAAVDNADALERFLREARAAARIRSEHVARVMDVGQLEDGSPYMVMEYLAGKDLSTALQKHGRFGVEQAVDYLAQTCEAIAEAHALGIIHRDLKPANLMLTVRSDGTECIKVLDFGISKSIEGEPGSELSMTRTDVIFGSPLYMSPEQMTSARNVDQRTDIWALGTILHELLAGSTPFQAENLASLAIKVAMDRPPALHFIRNDVPEGLSLLVLRCLEKNRADRFTTVGELALALLPFAPERAVANLRRAAAILRDASSGSPVVSAVTAPSVGQAPKNGAAEVQLTGRGWTLTHGTQRPRAGRVLIVALGALSVSALVILWLTLRASSHPVAESALSSAAVAASVAPTAAAQASPTTVSVTPNEPNVAAALPSSAAESSAAQAPPTGATKPVASASRATVSKPSSADGEKKAHTDQPANGHRSVYDDL